MNWLDSTAAVKQGAMSRDTTPNSCALLSCLLRAPMCLYGLGFQSLVNRVPAFPLRSAGMTWICFESAIRSGSSRRGTLPRRPSDERPVFSLDVKAAVRTAKESWHAEGAMSWAGAPLSLWQWEQKPVALESVS